MTQRERAEAVFEVMRTRRAVRAFTTQPVAVADIRRILEAARWASSAGNQRLHCFYVTRDPAKIDLISAIGPGFYGQPAAVIVICTDLEKEERLLINRDRDTSTWIDVGTAAMNMQLMAHALGLGTTPVTSVSTSGVRAALDLPPHLRPDLLLQLGYPAPVEATARGRRVRVEEMTDWEGVGGMMPVVEGKGRLAAVGQVVPK